MKSMNTANDIYFEGTIYVAEHFGTLYINAWAC